MNAHDNALGAVDDEGAAGSHQRKIAHKDVALFDFARRFVEQACRHAQRGGICGVANLTFDDAVVGVVNIEGVVHKVEHKVVLIVGDAGNILEHFLKSFLQKPAVGLLLHLNEVGHIDDFLDLAEAHSFGVAKLYGFDIYHRRFTPFVLQRAEAGPVRRGFADQAVRGLTMGISHKGGEKISDKMYLDIRVIL